MCVGGVFGRSVEGDCGSFLRKRGEATYQIHQRGLYIWFSALLLIHKHLCWLPLPKHIDP
ncbi:hypothetical protein GMJAKD_02475 [Candidatus Electrothrix aarhusensis]